MQSTSGMKMGCALLSDTALNNRLLCRRSFVHWEMRLVQS